MHITQPEWIVLAWGPMPTLRLVPAQRRARDLESRVASTPPSEFLPARLAAGRQEPLAPPMLLDSLDLGRDRWLLVLEAAPDLLTSAVIEHGEGFCRARAGDGVAEELLACTVTDRRSERFTFRRLGAIGPWTGERPIEVDQSNESIVVGERAVVKRSVWTASGNERPMVLPAQLVAAGFDEMPAPLGNVGWQHADGVAPLVSMTTYLPGARDGWEWYVEMLDRSLDDRSLDAIGPAAALGAITARLHVSLATSTDVLPAPTAAAGEDVVASWRRNAESDLDGALSLIDGDEGVRLRAWAGAIREELLQLQSGGTIAIPIHGDLHVGQFLRWRGGLAVSDLDGDPLGDGNLAGPPARDVASLVQSLDHVGRIVERRRRTDVAAWIRDAADVCLRSYRRELAAHGATSLFDEQLLRPLRVAQELHEFVYAARYLPGWRYVPDRALAAILERAP
jgi:maltokinase